jgi:hypothetical protein
MSILASQRFRQRLNELTRTAACGRKYVLVHSLKDYVRKHKSSLIEEAYSTNFFPRGSLDRIDQALLVFSILLETGYERYIEIFLRRDILDSSLWGPSLKEHIRDFLEKNTIDSASDIADKFEKCRWKYCPLEFNLGISRDIKCDVVLPIVRRKLINDKGATADLWKIDVPEEFVDGKLRSAVPHSRSNHVDPELKQYVRIRFRREILANCSN